MLQPATVDNDVATQLAIISSPEPLVRERFVSLNRAHLLGDLEAAHDELVNASHLSRNDEDMVMLLKLPAKIGAACSYARYVAKVGVLHMTAELRIVATAGDEELSDHGSSLTIPLERPTLHVASTRFPDDRKESLRAEAFQPRCLGPRRSTPQSCEWTRS